VPVRSQPLGHAQDLISDLPNNGIGCPIGVGHFAEEDAVQYPVSLSTGQPSDIECLLSCAPKRQTFFERFNRTVRHEWLSQCLWRDLDEVRDFATD